jgi:hypothetical protein
MPNCSLARHAPVCGQDTSGFVPAEDQQAIVKLYGSPRMSLRKVSAQTHWSPTTVRKVLQAHGVKMRGQGNTMRRISVNEELKRAELYGHGYSISQVAEMCGVTYEAVRQTLKRLGVTRPSHVRAPRQAPPSLIKPS